MDSYNKRGCDTIMCQFIENLYSYYNISTEVASEIEPKNYCNFNQETIM